MRLIDQVEIARRKQNLKIKTVCEHAGISPTGYDKYLTGERSPSFDMAIRLMDAVGKKYVLTDKDSKGVDKNMEWGMLSLYYNANKGNVAHLFKDISSIFFVSDAFIFATLKLGLLAVWFYKSHSKVAQKRLFMETIASEYEIDNLISKAKDLGLLNVDNSPSKLAYEFYNKSVISMNDYLSEASVACRLT